MNNVSVALYKVSDTLAYGQRVSSSSTSYWQGVARFSSPTKNLQQVAALEGLLDAVLHVHTHINLKACLNGIAEVTQRGVMTSYDIAAVQAANGVQWTLNIKERPNAD